MGAPLSRSPDELDHCSHSVPPPPPKPKTDRARGRPRMCAIRYVYGVLGTWWRTVPRRSGEMAQRKPGAGERATTERGCSPSMSFLMAAGAERVTNAPLSSRNLDVAVARTTLGNP